VVDQEAVTRALPLVPGTRMTLPLMLHCPQVTPTCIAASARLMQLNQTVLSLLRIPKTSPQCGNAFSLSPDVFLLQISSVEMTFLC